MRNVEIKAKVRDLDELMTKVRALSTNQGSTLIQHDTFYKTERGRLKLREFEDGSSELIYYQRPNQEGPKTCNYEKCTLGSETTHDLNKVLLLALGENGIVEKTRQLFMVGQTRVHIDNVQNLGVFMELEVMMEPEQTAEEGEEIAFSLMEKLGVAKEDLIPVAYTDLLNK